MTKLSVFNPEERPTERDFHASAIVDDKMYVFGGSEKTG